MISPEFCVVSFLGVVWFLSVYLAYHFGAWRRDRVWMNDSRRKLKCQYDSPWLTGY